MAKPPKAPPVAPTAPPAAAPAPKPAPKAKPKPPPPPSYVPNDDHRALVRIMIAGGIQQVHIASALKIHRSTLAKYYAHEIAHGAAEANAQVIAYLFKQCKDNVRAVEFWLTNKAPKEWAHTQKVAIDQNVTQNLGERLKRAQERTRRGK